MLCTTNVALAAPHKLAHLHFSIAAVTTVLCLVIPGIQTLVTKRGDNSIAEAPIVVLISLDGFRWDYFNHAELKNFNDFINRGVKAESLKSTFITKTFPNHFTMVTGLYEESHGIIANRMFDPVFNQTFVPSTTDSKWWNASVPIWIQNELHVQRQTQDRNNSETTRRSATIFWVGSNVEYGGKLPSFYFPKYNSSFSTEERFDYVISLLKGRKPPNFIACYIEEPDKTGHNYGPDSKEMKKTLVELDSLFGKFIMKMRSNGFLEHVNIIIVSDHGMASIAPENQILLDNIIKREWYTAVNIDVFASIYPKQGFTQRVYERLKNTSHLTVYLRKEIPSNLHYKNNRRVPEILALADEGYWIKQSRENISHTVGNHGYLNDYKSMHGIFVAAGPAFRKNYASKTFSNIHIYELLCRVLNIKPLPNNGSLFAVEHVLVDSLQTRHSIFESWTVKIILLTTLSLLMFLVLIGICVQCCKNNTSFSNGYIGAYRRGTGTYLYNLTDDFALDNESSEEDEI